jgi:hypothetical protein
VTESSQVVISKLHIPVQSSDLRISAVTDTITPTPSFIHHLVDQCWSHDIFMMLTQPPLQATFYALAGCLLTYAAFVALLAVPCVQTQVIYLSAITLTWFQDVSVPESWGYLRNQVTPFWLHTMAGESLHAWHILPLALYEEHEDELVLEKDGTSSDITQRLGFQLCEMTQTYSLFFTSMEQLGRLGQVGDHRAIGPCLPVHHGTSTQSRSTTAVSVQALAHLRKKAC